METQEWEKKRSTCTPKCYRDDDGVVHASGCLLYTGLGEELLRLANTHAKDGSVIPLLTATRDLLARQRTDLTTPPKNGETLSPRDEYLFEKGVAKGRTSLLSQQRVKTLEEVEALLPEEKWGAQALTDIAHMNGYNEALSTVRTLIGNLKVK